MSDEGAEHVVRLLRVWGVAGRDDLVGFADHDAHADFVRGFGGAHGLYGWGVDNVANGWVVADYLHEGEEGGGELVVVEEVRVGREKAKRVAKGDFGQDLQIPVSLSLDSWSRE